MTFSQFLSILRARWLSAVVTLVLTVGTTVAISLFLPKSYTATASVVLDVRSPDPIAGVVLGAMAMPSYMATQADILKSPRVAMRVIQNLRIAENSTMRARWMDETGGRGNYESWIVDMLGKGLTVEPSRESNVIEVAYRNVDPAFAATLANAYVKAYIDISVGLRAVPAKQYSEFFDERAKKMREDLEAAQVRLANYQKEKGITGLDERFDTENQRLNELNTQLVTLQAMAIEAQSRSQQARTSGDQLQDVINNPVVAGLRADLSRMEAKLGELTARLGDAHPQVREMRANIDELRARLEAETRRASGSVGVNQVIARQREVEVRAALEAQRAKVLKLKEQRQEMIQMAREIESLQRNYDMVVQRQTQAGLESQYTQTNISVLAPATEPADPSSPKIVLNTVLSVFLGLMLAMACALLRELTDRRVHSLDDLSGGIGLPVLGVLPGPNVKRLGHRSSIELPHNVLARLPKPGA